MSERQERALEEIADRPRRLPRATGEALVRRGLASRERSCVYAITDLGRELRERRIRENRVALLKGKLSKEDRERLGRALAWIDFVGQLTREGRRYATICLAALIAEADAPPSGYNWGEDSDEVVMEHARVALGAVNDCDEIRTRAKVGGGDVVVSWSVEGASPVRAKEERRAAVRASSSEGIPDLSEYRKRRGA